MSRYSTSKAKDAITGHARANGWAITSDGDNMTLKRGRVTIAVRFAATGDVFKASVLGDRALYGKDKLGQVIRELNREP